MHSFPKIFTLAALAMAAGGALAADADFPNKPIKIVVGFPAGQGTDTIARALTPKLQAVLGQALIVDNKAGAGGILGQQAAATAVPDGYTILFTSAGPMAVNPGVYEKLPYDPVKDYTGVAGVISVPLVLVANAAFPAKNAKELVALAKAKPGEINFASSGNGVTKSTATVNGIKYTIFVSTDAGAGNRYETTSYRTVQHGQCYAIEYTIHYAVLENFDPSSGVTGFDQKKVHDALDGIVQSLQFLPQ